MEKLRLRLREPNRLSFTVSGENDPLAAGRDDISRLGTRFPRNVKNVAIVSNSASIRTTERLSWKDIAYQMGSS
jgi:hypothetical protein